MLPPASHPRLVDSGLTGRVNQHTSYFTKILTEGIVRFWARETQGVIDEMILEAGNVGRQLLARRCFWGRPPQPLVVGVRFALH